MDAWHNACAKETDPHDFSTVITHRSCFDNDKFPSSISDPDETSYDLKIRAMDGKPLF
jgi:hypothetical protein